MDSSLKLAAQKALEACPFCGVDAGDLQTSQGFNCTRHSVYCMDCSSEGPLAYSRDDAIERWNARALQHQEEREPVPFWYAVVSEDCPVINKPYRRADFAEEYAQQCREDGRTSVEVIPLYATRATRQGEKPSA